MKLTRRVSVTEVKRAFAVSQFMRPRRNDKRRRGSLSGESFKKALKRARKKTLSLSPAGLDKIIGGGYAKRLNAYNDSRWYIGRVSTSEVGVWKQAGGLPLSWTSGSLRETARKTKRALETNSKFIAKRARRVLPGILKTGAFLFQREKYLLPIIFKHGTGTNGRKGLGKPLAGDIDDGCMRSVASAVSGARHIRAYIGFPKKRR